jgi:hypothetical protein
LPLVKVNFQLTSYNPPGLTDVDYALNAYAPSLDGNDFALVAYTVPALTEVDFELGTGGPTYYGILKRWTGSTWVKETLQTYLSSTWQSKPLKRWDSSDWRLIDTTGV